MLPAVLLSPAFKGLITTASPWWIGATIVGALVGSQTERNAQRERRVAELEKKMGAARESVGARQPAATHQASENSSPNTAQPNATPTDADRVHSTDDISTDEEASAKVSLLRKIVESNILLRKPREA